MKWHGLIGFETQVEVSPGPGKATVWKPQIVTHHYYGDVLQINKRYDNGSKINDDITIRNQFSIISDPYANDNFMNMKWIEWRGKKWKVTDVSVDVPRLTVSIGGMYQDGNDT